MTEVDEEVELSSSESSAGIAGGIFVDFTGGQEKIVAQESQAIASGFV